MGHCDFPRINHGILYDDKKDPPFSSVPIGKTFYYSCEYSFVSPSKSFWNRITCREEGWSPTPRCLRLCFFPFVENGHSASSGQTHLEGDTVQIVCDIGYSLPGNTDIITCLEDGWSSPPKCSSTGLVRVGPDSVQCYHFGWSPNFPTCKEQVQSCGQPPQLPNGKTKQIRKEEYEHGEMVEYDCNPAFLMMGPKNVQCIDGEWTNLPTCFEHVKTCGYVPHLKNGYAQPSVPPYRPGVSVEVHCRNAYTMVGNNVITCIDGMWTELPKCVATDQLKSCKIPNFYRRKLISPWMPEYNHNARINYRCLGKSAQMQISCINGNWYPEPNCRGKETQLCPPPPQIPNAQNMLTTVNYQDGEKVAILCKENYLLHGAREIVCKSGKWQSLPQCIESTQYCGSPPPISNGDITSFPLTVYPPGSKVQYHCQSFYELRGSIDVTCRNGQWSEPPKCIDACIISEDNMNKYNVQLRGKDTKKLYVKTGDFVEFECKWPHRANTSIQSFRAICQEGEVEYPRCE
ncbi:complement factor H-related protein 5 [Prionailurus iriomotensis]